MPKTILELEQQNAELLRTLSNIVLNATLQPDPTMAGATDSYSVPLDDIEEARKLIYLI